ncbi:MAG: metallophosphoesterase [Geminicoccaceae bacterium]
MALVFGRSSVSGTAMKILIVADLHYSLRQYDWLLQQAEAFDALIMAGDLLERRGHIEQDLQAVIVSKYLTRLAQRTQVLVASGNHDIDVAATSPGTSWLDEARDVGVAVDTGAVMLGPLTFTLCPYWNTNSERDVFEQQMLALAARVQRPWLWVHHVPPKGTIVDWNGRKHAGDRHLTKQISALAPDAVISGHVHDAPFRAGGSWCGFAETTQLFNPGRQWAPVPSHIILDLDARAAFWTSLAGSDRTALPWLDRRRVKPPAYVAPKPDGARA